MRLKWTAVVAGLCGLGMSLGVAATSARADVVTEQAASILIFPKVLNTSGVDTVIQITNRSQQMVHVHCFYVDAQLPSFCDQEDPRTGCNPQWNETDFTIWLTRQQPTHWKVSSGRPIDPSDDFMHSIAGATMTASDGAGLDPGAIPPVSDGFTGELKCVQVNADGGPVGANSLIGQATLKSKNSSDVSKYNAIGILGSNLVGATGNTLLLNKPRDGSRDGEYNACPAVLQLNFFAGDVEDLVNGDAEIDTELTLVPCSENFETQQGSKVIVQFAIYNEFEEKFSASTTVNCWKNGRLSDIDSPNNGDDLSVFSEPVLGTMVAHARITPADPTDGTFNGAVVGVAEVTRADGNSARAAVNIHTEGDRFTGTDGGAFDQIVLPEQF
ncbi:MAG: hypothetical protein HY027_20230 [Deltaproteobacteria bacterium]|nr:hypothetical protein [Deltaproteobacteria bacterium]